MKRLIATAIAVGTFGGGALAADLGGNCCADLEERVAELEATVASSQTWIVLEMFVGATPQPDGTPAKLADIGSAASGLKCPKMARGYALGVVGAGLDVLVKHWGLK